MKKATLKKLSAIFMSVVMLLTVFSGCIVTSAEGTEEASVNILADEAVIGDLYKIVLPEAITDNVEFDATEQAKLVYGENHTLEACGDTSGFIFKQKDANGKYVSAAALGLTDDQIIDQKIIANNNAEKFAIVSQNNNIPLGNRAAIGFDLGAYYDLDELILTQNFYEGRKIYNFSVYVGNKMDETIFQNKVATGGSATETTLTATFADDVSGRYVLIVFDHVGTKGTTNRYEYEQFSIGNIELYGEKQPVVATNILTETDVIGDLYKIVLPEPITHDVDFDEKEQAKLVYGENHTLEACTDTSGFRFARTDVNDENNSGSTTDFITAAALGLTDDQVIDDKIIANNNAEEFIILSQTSEIPLGNRAAIGFDLGTYYDLDELVLTQNFYSNRKIYNFSVYVGNKMDETIFQNKVATGGSDTEATLTATFADDVSGRYVLIVFDHVSTYGKTNKWAYEKFSIGNIELYGREVVEPEAPIYGDINSDSKVNILDYIALSKVIDGEMTVEVVIANLNGDEGIDVYDLIILKKILLGIEVTAPATSTLLDPDLNADGTDGVDAF